MFAAFTPEHRCHVPTCDGLIENITKIEAPFTSFAMGALVQDEEFLKKAKTNISQCDMHISEGDECLEEAFNPNSSSKNPVEKKGASNRPFFLARKEGWAGIGAASTRQAEER